MIRRAESKDTEKIMDLLVQVCEVHHNGRPDLFRPHGGTKYVPEQLMEMYADDERPIFVLEEDGAVKGYAFCILEVIEGDTARTDMRTLYIDDICVDEAARGQHVGECLYQYVLNYAREIGCYNVTLNVWSCNPGAMKFYEKMGLKPYKVGMEQIL